MIATLSPEMHRPMAKLVTDNRDSTPEVGMDICCSCGGMCTNGSSLVTPKQWLLHRGHILFRTTTGSLYGHAQLLEVGLADLCDDSSLSGF